MKDPGLSPINLDDEFGFACHKNVRCFNQCCRDLNQALTPYDVVRLKSHLNITAGEFLERYAVVYSGPSTGLPVASLRFSPERDHQCPFVTPNGCMVYEARPSSCRIYPLARAIQRSRSDGAVTEHYAVLREDHCLGFEEESHQTVRQWITDQELDIYNRMNDAMMELIALKNQHRPGELSADHQAMVRMAFYDLDTLKEKALSGELSSMAHSHLIPLPKKEDDPGWLMWAFSWIGQILFGKRISSEG